MGVALALAVYGPYLSNRYVARALKTFATRPSSAYADLSRAASLNPWSTQPAISEGTVAEQLRNTARARAAFERALRVEKDWYPMLQLALLDAKGGHFPAALDELQRAAKLDADDPVIVQARDLIDHRQRIDPVQFNQLFFQGANTSLFKPQNLK
jgi:tetratricopeptide (TPR) repeat protein